MEVLDLSILTPEMETTVGDIEGTNISVTSIESGKIVYQIRDVDKTVLNGIRFLVKENEYSQITYTIN